MSIKCLDNISCIFARKAKFPVRTKKKKNEIGFCNCRQQGKV